VTQCELPLDEVRRRYRYIGVKLWHDQYRAKFYPSHPIPEQHLAAELKLFWQGVIPEIHGWKFWENAWDALCDFGEWVWEHTFEPGIKALLDGLGWIADKARELIEGALKLACRVGGWLWGAIRGAVGYVWDKVVAVFSWLKTTAKAIWDGIASTLGLVWNYLKRVGLIVASALRPLFNWIWSGIQAVGGKIWEGAVWVKDRAVEAFSAAWDSMRSWLGRIMGEIIDALRTLGGWIKDAFVAAGQAIVQGAKWVWDSVLVPAGQAVIKGLEWIWGKITDIVTGVIRAILNICRSWAPMTPERSPDAFFEILKIGSGAVAGLAGLTLIGEAVHPLKQLGFPHISAMFYDLSSYKIITGAAMSALGFCMFKQPMTYFFSNMFRPRMPDKRDIIEARSRGLLTKDEAKRMMGYVGFADDYYYIWEDMSKTPVKYFALRAVASGGYYDYDIFEDDMRRSGYPKETRDMLHQMYQALSAYEVKGVYVGTALSRYRDGLTTLEQLDEELKMLRTPGGLRQIYATAAQLMRDTAIRKDAIKKVTKAYSQGKLTIEQASTYLRELGIEDAQVQAWMLNQILTLPEDIYQTPEEEVRAYGRSTVIRRFKEGLITEAEFEQEMRLLGYTTDQIQRFLILARLEYDYDHAMDLLATAKDAYRKGLIGDDEFLDWLARIPIGAERAKTYLLREQIRKAGKIAS